MTPEEIRAKEFFVEGRGYDLNEVQSFLSAVADDYARVLQELEAAREATAPPAIDPVDQLGQHVADIVRASRDAADQLLQDAQNAAMAYRSLAEEQARRVRTEADEERARATAVLAEAEAHRSRVMAACELMTSQLLDVARTAQETIQSFAPPTVDVREPEEHQQPEPFAVYGDA